MRPRALALGWGLGMALLAGCQEKEEAPRLAPYTGPLMQTENVRIILSDSARTHIRLSAPLEQDYESGDRLYPKGATVLFYDKPGRTVVNTIEAQWVKYESNRQLYILRKDVRVVNVPKQQRLFTEELFYDRLKQRIYTNPKTFVRVQTPVDSLTGYGLEATQDFSLYSVLRLSGKLDASGSEQ